MYGFRKSFAIPPGLLAASMLLVSLVLAADSAGPVAPACEGSGWRLTPKSAPLILCQLWKHMQSYKTGV
jgi:hypothetical protein